MNENEQKQKDAKKKNFGLFFASSPVFFYIHFIIKIVENFIIHVKEMNIKLN